MDNTAHLAEGRRQAMENYVDFNGENKKSWLSYEKVSQLPSSDKNMYMSIAIGAMALQIGAGIYGVHLAHKKWGKAGFWWGALGFFVVSIPTGILLNELQKITIQKKLENQLALTPNLSGAEQAAIANAVNNAYLMSNN